ncbi:hypothetical protein QBC37DRAFT_418296 [Rhypophila decipiens]|uniref:Secreted protein n=1 Tax=Rhypophila decipiens TaxID=261697 RepID=A0AAN7BA91_9PEZI|nr:hypothetical protein QBC37DRAFT_418296 [Rhypophila decipiens]
MLLWLRCLAFLAVAAQCVIPLAGVHVHGTFGTLKVLKIEPQRRHEDARNQKAQDGKNAQGKVYRTTGLVLTRRHAALHRIVYSHCT